MKKLFLSTLLLSLTVLAFSGEKTPTESELLEHIKTINSYNNEIKLTKRRVNPIEDLKKENQILTDLLLKYTSEDASTLTQPFDSLRKYMFIATSEDGKLRIYSWQKEENDDMKYYENIFQYEAEGKVYSTKLVEDDDFNPKGLYTAIETFEKDSNEVIYFGKLDAIFSEKDYSTSIETFKIEGTELIDSLMIFKVYDDFDKLETKHNISVLYNPNKKKIR